MTDVEMPPMAAAVVGTAGSRPRPLPSELRAADLMAVELLTVDVTEGLLMAWELVSQAGVHHVPVLDEGRCVGLLTERDLALEVERNPLGHPRRLVRELIGGAPVMVGPDDLAGEVAAGLLRTGKDAVLVGVDAASLVGLITQRDLLRALAGQVVPRPAGQSWDHALTLFQITPVLSHTGGTGDDGERPHTEETN